MSAEYTIPMSFLRCWPRLLAFCVALSFCVPVARADDGFVVRDIRLEGLARLSAALPGLMVNASREHRIAGNLNLTFPAAPAAELMRRAPELCVSTGSACSSAAIEPSYVLRALGLSADAAARTLRVGIGRFTSTAEIDTAAELLVSAHAAATQAVSEA